MTELHVTEKRKSNGMKSDFEELCKDAQECINRGKENLKMTFIEEMSLMIGNALASMILVLILFVAFMCILAAAVSLLARYAGFAAAMAIAGIAVAILAAVIHSMRERLFIDGIVKHLCRLLMLRREDDEKE